MARIAYVNGRYVPMEQAAVHIEDRGFQFADGVYEVIALRDGHLMDERGHLDRLYRSLAELRITPPMDRTPLAFVMRETVQRNGLRNAAVYLQVTRGRARRDFKFPGPVKASLVITVRSWAPDPVKQLTEGIQVVTTPDLRWKRRDIKSVALLPQVLAKQAAADAGCYEAWMVDDDGTVTEGASSNAWIVTKDKRVVTRPATTRILKGVTRTAITALIEQHGYRLEERAFTPHEAYEAEEAFVSAATAMVLPVVRIDGKPIGDGKPGPMTMALREAYVAYGDVGLARQLPWTDADIGGLQSPGSPSQRVA